MKRIAVIGCSTSSYDQARYSGEHNIDWVELLSRQCPEDEFHNYASPAHGPLYYDYVLKHIIANLPSNYYDTVIIQYTVLGRWFFPIKSLDNNNDVQGHLAAL